MGSCLRGGSVVVNDKEVAVGGPEAETLLPLGARPRGFAPRTVGGVVGRHGCYDVWQK